MFLNFDKFNHLFGGKQRLDSVDVKPYEDDQKKLLDTLEKMDKDYKQSVEDSITRVEEYLPEDPGYEYISYNGPDESEIESSTKAKYEDLLAEKLSSMLEDLSFDVQQQENKKKQYADDAAKTSGLLREKYDKEKKQTQNGIMSRGMGRSSVYGLASDAYDEMMESDIGDVMKRMQDNIAEADGKISQLEQQFKTAAENLDIEYAGKIAKEISELKSKRDSDINAVTRYNNDISRKILKYREDRQESIDKQNKELEKQAEELARKESIAQDYTGAKQENYKQRLAAATDFYKQYPKDVAEKLIDLNIGQLSKYLGYYVDDLKSALSIK